MDTTPLVLAGAVSALAVVTIWAVLRNRHHARAVEGAIDRIGGSTPRRRWRSLALDESLVNLERSTATAQRERARLAGALQAAPLGIIVTDDHGLVVAAS